jgi:hypothetical protein
MHASQTADNDHSHFLNYLLQLRLLPQSLAKTLIVWLLKPPLDTGVVLSVCSAGQIWITLLIYRHVEVFKGLVSQRNGAGLMQGGQGRGDGAWIVQLFLGIPSFKHYYRIRTSK